MRTHFFFLALLAFLIAFSGCAGEQALPILQRTDSSPQDQVKDPKGPIPDPQLPADLATAGQKSAAETPKTQPGGYGYDIDVTIRKSDSNNLPEGQQQDTQENATNGERQSTQSDATDREQQGAQPDVTDGEEKKEPSESGQQKETPKDKAAAPNNGAAQDDESSALLSTFAETSILHRMADSPPESVIGLEQRLAVALGEGRAVLNSYGFYAGQVSGRVEKNTKDSKSKPALVRIEFTLGPQYRVGKTTVIATLPKNGAQTAKKLPKTLVDAGLAEGTPAVAADVLAAVDKVQEEFMENGYPFAKVSKKRFFADHEKRQLEAEVSVDPGAFVRMGDLHRDGAPSIKESFIEAQRNWEKGDPWNQKTADSFNDSLRQSGLFKSITIKPGSKDLSEDGTRTVEVQLESAAERTISGLLQYNTDFGPGAQIGWEHRNFTGRGDSLRLSATVWLDMQEVSANYRLPYFFDPSQSFIAKASGLHEDLDAYRMTTGALSLGIERYLSDSWKLSLTGSAEGGEVRESLKEKRQYSLVGLPVGLTYDNTNNPLDATSGQRLILNVIPYYGSYNGDFTVFRTRAEGQAFLPIIGESTLMLAARSAIGAVLGSDSDTVPPSVRFYSGGGGSVRGYKYQSIGPRNLDKDPLGGGSFIEGSLEMRWNVRPAWGFVVFIDGGAVYENVFPKLGDDIRWGAGVGFRYHTAIGPIRFDIATPLNPRDDDDSFQIYISIGQNF